MSSLKVLRRLQRSTLASACFLVAGLGAFLLSVAAERAASGGALQVEAPVRDLGELVPQDEVQVAFSVTNQSGNPIKLLGVSGFCVSWGCVYATDFPIRLAAHASTTFKLRLRPKSDQSSDGFVADVVLFSDAPGCERTPLRIKGRVLHAADH